MTQDITSSIDTSLIVDAATIDAADVTTPINNLITVINAVLNGTQAFDRLLFDAAETLTLSGGVLSAPSKMLVNISSESGTSDDVDTITASNKRLAIFRATSGHTITLKSLTGNLNTGGGDMVITVGRIAIGICEGGFWTLMTIGAPYDAKYIVQTASGGLSAEQALSSLATGTMKVTTSTGVVSSMKENTISTEPTAGQDNTQGYAVGSTWYDTSSDSIWRALDVTTNQAKWLRSGSNRTRNGFSARASAATILGMGIANPTIANSGSIANANTVNGTYVSLPTTSSSGNLGGIVSTTFNLLRLGANATFECFMEAGPSLANVRLWIGLCSADVTNTDDLSGAATQFVGFRHSSVSTLDAGWRPVTCDGTTQNASSAVIGTVATSTAYYLRVRIPSADSTAYFSVNGSAETAVSVNLPASTTDLGFVVRCITVSANARQISLGRFVVSYYN